MSRIRLTKHFTIEEFDCRDGTPVPPQQVRDILLLVHYWLQPLRDHFGAVHVLSGYRTVSHNRSVGGAVHSVHLLQTPLPETPARSKRVGAAADVVCRHADARDVLAWARRHVVKHSNLGPMGRGGIGYYPTAGFVHLDTGPRREWEG